MKKLLVCVLILNTLLVGDRILLTFAASSGGNAGLEVPDLEQRLADVEALLAGVDGRVTTNESDIASVDGRVGTLEGQSPDRNALVNVPDGFAKGVDDGTTKADVVAVVDDVILNVTTLSDLACADGQIAKIENGEWVCSIDESGPDLSDDIESLEQRLRFIEAGFTPLGMNPDTGLEEYRQEQTSIEFVLLPGGTFDMGSPESEPNSDVFVDGRERPVHEVTLDPFLIAKTEVTQAQYEAVMASNPSNFTGDDQRPVETVSWNALKAADGFLARTGLSLPSEAQWEYAARGGTVTAFSFGDDCNANSCDVCAPAESSMWWCGNASNTTHPVGKKQPNAFGLFDMHGNVWEWCEDVFDPGFYSTPEAAGPNPVGTSGSVYRVFRGGSWSYRAGYGRSASRSACTPVARPFTVGFRPARPLP